MSKARTSCVNQSQQVRCIFQPIRDKATRLPCVFLRLTPVIGLQLVDLIDSLYSLHLILIGQSHYNTASVLEWQTRIYYQ